MLGFGKALKSPSLVAAFRRLLSTVDLPNPPTSAAYDELIATAASERDFDTVHNLLNKRHAHRFYTTNYTFKFVSDDLSLLNDLLKTLSRLHERACRKKAYDSLVASLSRARRTDVALRVVDEMIRGKYGADACTFYPVLRVLTRTKNQQTENIDEAWRVLEFMRENDIARDITCYNFFVTSYCFTGDLRSAVGVLRKMEKEGLNADYAIYDALVLGACKAGKVDGGMEILRRMLLEGVEPVYGTYAHVIKSLVKLGNHAQAVEFVMIYAGKDKKLDQHIFEVLATYLIAEKKYEEAKNILEEMVTRELQMSENLIEFHNQQPKSKC